MAGNFSTTGRPSRFTEISVKNTSDVGVDFSASIKSIIMDFAGVVGKYMDYNISKFHKASLNNSGDIELYFPVAISTTEIFGRDFSAGRVVNFRS